MIGALYPGEYQTQAPAGPLPSSTPGYIIATDVGAGDGITRDAYAPGNEIRITAKVYEIGSIPYDPATLTLTLTAPAALPAAVPPPLVLSKAQLSRTSLGHYEYVGLVVTPGQWLYRWACSGPTADTGARSFWVLAQ